jgi:hypothetical protein
MTFSASRKTQRKQDSGGRGQQGIENGSRLGNIQEYGTRPRDTAALKTQEMVQWWLL